MLVQVPLLSGRSPASNAATKSSTGSSGVAALVLPRARKRDGRHPPPHPSPATVHH
jgi:hypothetical protein